MEELLFTVPEVAKLLKVDQHKVYNLIEKRLLKEYNGKDLSNLDEIVDL